LSWLFFLSLSAGGPTLSYQYTVVIDPGHGGKDPGAIGVGGICEKGVTIAIAQMVYLKALEIPELRIVLSRRNDVHVPAAERIHAANQIGADVYISIHANAFSQASVSGIETLVHETEGRKTAGYRLAEILQRRLVAHTGARDRGVKRAPLFIRQAKMPAALVEAGFLTNPVEARKLESPSYQDKIADAILSAILEFLGEDPT
jgi:N-acetylmuramoyl-L-alanine amidase